MCLTALWDYTPPCVLINGERLYFSQMEKSANRFTENDIFEFVADLLQDDPAEKDYQKNLIDNLVVKVFVGDGYITAHIKPGNATEVADILLEEVKKALEHLFTSVQTLSPLAQREGFEPSVPLRGTHDFQSCSLGRSDISARRSRQTPHAPAGRAPHLQR